MKNNHNYRHFNMRRLVTLTYGFFMISLYTAGFGFIWENYYNDYMSNSFYRNGNFVLYFLYALVLFALFNSFKCARIVSNKLGDIIYSQLIATVITNAFAYVQVALIARRFSSVLPLLIYSGIQFVFSIMFNLIVVKTLANTFPAHKMIVVYGSKSATMLVEKMSMRMDKYIIEASVSVTEGIDVITEKISKYDAVIICDVPNDIRNDILKYCFNNHIRTYLSPKISDIIVRGAEELHTFDSPLLLCKNSGLQFDQLFLKRTMDIILSAIALIIASPFMLVTALAIKLYDHGPVFYKQKRLTLNGREFYVYKFRSMITDAEKDGVARLSSKSDDRITPIGRFIRKTRIDELPQLINIINGDMSFVGPRPERPEIAKEYEKDMPEFGFRLNVKAGLTGFAQVNGKYNTTPYDKLKLDLMYIEQYSFILDLKLMLQTVKIVFTPESTEGINDNQVTAQSNEYKIKEKV